MDTSISLDDLQLYEQNPRRISDSSSKRIVRFSVTIKSNRLTFLWLKTVQAFNPAVHCARCLVGRYSNLFPFGRQAAGVMLSGEETAQVGDILYLCGVTWDYHSNVHMPMRVSDSHSVITIDTTDLQIRITGAEPIEFPALPSGYRNLSGAYTTCRNYQFGVYAAEKGLIPERS